MSITRLRIIQTDELKQRNTRFGKFIPSWHCTSINSSATRRRCAAIVPDCQCSSMSVLKAGEGTASPRSIALTSYSHPQHLFVRMRLRGKSSAESAIQFINYSQFQTYRSSKSTPCLRSNSRYSSWNVRVRWCSCWLTLRTERGLRLSLCQRKRIKVRDCRALGEPETSP
jgi:hypothetical protein